MIRFVIRHIGDFMDSSYGLCVRSRVDLIEHRLYHRVHHLQLRGVTLYPSFSDCYNCSHLEENTTIKTR